MGQDFLDLGAWLLEAEEDGECHNQVEGGQQTFLHCRDTICNMVLIIEGDSEIGAHPWSNPGYLIWLRHLLRSRAKDGQAEKNKVFDNTTTFFNISKRHEKTGKKIKYVPKTKLNIL